MIAGELAALLHELSDALVARGRGQEVTRIVFHGFRAETISEGMPVPGPEEAVIALPGPGINLTLAALAQGLPLGFDA